MGREAECEARVGARAGRVKALLETTELILRGAIAARMAFVELEGVQAKNGRLTFRYKGESVVLELGKEAESWASKILNPKSRVEKLGIKAGQRDKADLKRLKALSKNIAQNGAIWLLRPKGRDDYQEADSRATARAAGLVDVKVVAFSDALSAEKYVIPVAKRRT